MFSDTNANGEFCVLCSVLIIFYATVPEAVCMMMASTRSNHLRTHLFDSCFQRMALKFSSYSFELVYPFTPRSAQNENSSSSRQVRNS